MSFIDKMRTQRLLSFTMILFTLSLGIVIGTVINSGGVKAARDNQAAQGATPLTIPNPVELSNSFSQIAKQVEPSVVNISTSYLPKAPTRARNNGSGRGNRQMMPPDQSDQGDGGDGMDFLYRFFGNSPFGGGGGTPESQNRGEALGSGVVVDKAGFILTNNHVVDKADRIQVRFMNDPTEYDAKVVGVDALTDLAVIRVEGRHDLIPAKLGNSDAVQVGDWAMAIGSPFGFQATVTAGIISAKERDIQGESTQFQHFLQTDAAINPGNSGGPLLNIRGEVIGINTAIASRSGGYQGIGFAMPINTAAMVYNEIIKSGKVTRGSIGIRFTNLPARAKALLKSEGLSEGVFAETVVAGGPADKGGMKEGDIIIALNGKPVKDGNDLISMVTATPIGTAVNITVLRNKQKENLKVVVSDLTQVFADEYGTPSETGGSAKPEATTVSFGMGVVELTPAMRERLGFKESGGVQIDNVEPNSFAEDIGLLKGDILAAINHQPVNSVADIQRIQKTLKPGDAVQFRVFSRLENGGRSGPWSARYTAGTLR